ncbi:putative ABC transporter ATP-binding protein [Spirochaetia bacterium]|nr:putative ABC transporter ATP-binding protein [Spirochaetia bacterium]
MIEVKHLTVKYNVKEAQAALDDISFTVESGERIALIGANGAGKSTLLLALIGILPPSSGDLCVDGIPVKKDTLREIRRRMGLVFQNPDDQLFMPTVEDDIAFGQRNYGLDEETIQKRTAAVLESLDISRLEHRLAHHLSGGEKRLAALAGVLVMEPAILLLDEPGSFLDPRSRRNLISILSGLSQTMMIATHDFDLAQKLCSRVILLAAGRIRADGPTEEVLRDAALLEENGL